MFFLNKLWNNFHWSKEKNWKIHENFFFKSFIFTPFSSTSNLNKIHYKSQSNTCNLEINMLQVHLRLFSEHFKVAALYHPSSAKSIHLSLYSIWQLISFRSTCFPSHLGFFNMVVVFLPPLFFPFLLFFSLVHNIMTSIKADLLCLCHWSWLLNSYLANS